MHQDKTQKLYIAIDDSGIITNKEKYAIYGGIILFSEKQLNNFIIKYKNIIKKIKYKPYYHFNQELKHSNLKNIDIIKIMHYLNNFELIACIIDNSKIYKGILNKPKSKGRFIDYAIKMLIKNSIKDLIKNKKLNPNQNLEIYLYVDETSYKSNGYYKLEESIYEELKYGIHNIKDNNNFKNIINGNLKVFLSYEISKKNYFVQAADIIAGHTRKQMLQNKKMSFLKHQIFLP